MNGFTGTREALNARTSRSVASQPRVTLDPGQVTLDPVSSCALHGHRHASRERVLYPPVCKTHLLVPELSTKTRGASCTCI